MLKTILSAATYLFIPLSVFSQPSYPRDTSFTIQTTYRKEIQYRPYIRIAEAPVSRRIQEQYGVSYKRIGDRALTLDIFSPKNSANKKYPGIILIHGGGWSSGEKSQMHTLGKDLADRGYICYAVSYRLTPEAPYPAAVLDIKDAISWLKQSGTQANLDTSKIVALGTSAGGQLAALLGTTNRKTTFAQQRVGEPSVSTVQAVVNIDGILAFHHPESAEGKSASAWLLGNYTESPSNWNEASALSHVSPNSAPILFLNSSNPRFHAGRDDMIKKFDRYGVYSEVHEFADSPHPFWFFEPWYTPMVRKIEAFLNRVLTTYPNN